MGPIEVERKGEALIGVKPEEKVITVNAGEKAKLQPVHHINIEVVCDNDGDCGFVSVEDTSIKIVKPQNGEEIITHCEKLIEFGKNETVKILSRDLVVAEIRHVEPK